jgi:hypothetical protein
LLASSGVRQIGLLAVRYCCMPLRNETIVGVESREKSGRRKMVTERDTKRKW